MAQTLREVLAQLDVEVRGLGKAEAANAAVDRYTAAASAAASEIEKLKLRQQEEFELAGRIGRRIRQLQKAEGDRSRQIEELRLAQIRASEAGREYARQADEIRKSQLAAAAAEKQHAEQASRLSVSTQQTARAVGGGGVTGLVGSVRGAMGVLAGMAAAAASAAAAFHVVRDAIAEVIAVGGAVDDTAKRLNLSARAVQEWSYVAERADLSAEQLERAFAKLAQTASSGDGPFAQLGVATRDASGELRSQEAIFGETIRALAGVENRTERAALAQRAFGRSGAELLVLIEEGPEKVDELRARFAELGGGLSDEVVAGADGAGEAMQDFRLAMLSLKGALATDVLPALTNMVLGVSSVIAKIAEVTRTSSVVQTALGMLAAAFGALVIATLPVSAPLALIVLGLAALFLVVEDVVTAFRGGDSVFGRFVEWMLQSVGVTTTLRGTLEQVAIGWEIVKSQALDAIGRILLGIAQLQTALGMDVSTGLREAIGDIQSEALAGRVRAAQGQKEHQASEEARRAAQRAQYDEFRSNAKRRSFASVEPAGAAVPKRVTRAEQRAAQQLVRAPVTINIRGGDPRETARLVDEKLGSHFRGLADTLPEAEPA